MLCRRRGRSATRSKGDVIFLCRTECMRLSCTLPTGDGYLLSLNERSTLMCWVSQTSCFRKSSWDRFRPLTSRSWISVAIAVEVLRSAPHVDWGL